MHTNSIGNAEPVRIFYEDTRWCENCGGPQLMMAVVETDIGRLWVCLGCEKEKFIWFKRVTVGAA